VGLAGHGLAPMKLRFQHVSCQVSKKRIQGGKGGAAIKLGCPAILDGQPAGLTSGPPKPHFCPKHQLNPPINTPTPPGRKCEESVSLASKVLQSLVLVE
jgi:hypothetical protein